MTPDQMKLLQIHTSNKLGRAVWNHVKPQADALVSEGLLAKTGELNYGWTEYRLTPEGWAYARLISL